jgi:hypothetical protein
MQRTIEVPAPIGETFHHRYVNGTVSHHEAPWEGLMAECRICGIKAVLSLTPLQVFINDDELMGQLCETKDLF